MAILLPAEASSLILDWPFLIGIEGPIQNVAFTIRVPDQDNQRQATCYSVISSIEVRLGTSSWFRRGTD